METVKRMVLSQWSLADTCMCTLSSVSSALVIALNLIGGRMHHTAASEQKTLFPTQGLRCLENSSFLSFQHCQGDTIHWPDPLRIWKLWREWLCHNSQLLTHACVPFILHRVEQNFTWLSCLGHSATLQDFSYWQIILPKLLGWMSPSHQRGTYSLQLLEKTNQESRKL